MFSIHHLTKTILFLLLGASLLVAAEPEMLLEEAFDRDAKSLPSGWIADQPGLWRIADGQLKVNCLKGQTLVTVGKPEWQNYEITATATFDQVANDSRWLSVVFRSAEKRAMPWSHFCLRFGSAKPNGVEFATRASSKTWTIRGRSRAAADCQLGQPRQLRVVVQSNHVQAFVDGQKVIDSPFCIDNETGLVGLAASGCVARFDDFRVRALPATPLWSSRPLKPCAVIAHRGFSAVAPENTLSAIDRAKKAGASGSECDVRLTQDGRIMLMHDETVDRTTNGKGKINDLTLNQLKKLDAGSWKGRTFAGERIPTLVEVLAAHKGTGCTAVVEIKQPGMSQQVVDAIREAGMLEQAAVIAFDGNVVREVRTIEPRLPCAWLCGKALSGTPAQRADWIAAEAAKYKTSIVDLGYSMLSPEVIAELRQRGIATWAWTVNDPKLIEALMHWGVEAVTTDCPSVMVQCLKKSGVAPAAIGKATPLSSRPLGYSK